MSNERMKDIPALTEGRRSDQWWRVHAVQYPSPRLKHHSREISSCSDQHYQRVRKEPNSQIGTTAKFGSAHIRVSWRLGPRPPSLRFSSVHFKCEGWAEGWVRDLLPYDSALSTSSARTQNPSTRLNPKCNSWVADNTVEWRLQLTDNGSINFGKLGKCLVESDNLRRATNGMWWILMEEKTSRLMQLTRKWNP